LYLALNGGTKWGASNSHVISIERAKKDSHFYANTIINTDTVNGYAIYLYGHNGEVIDNLTFSYEDITGKDIRITGISGETSTIGVNFCSCGLANSDVSLGPGIHDWSITPNNCPSTPAPLITGVSGTITNGSEITITGSDFGANGPTVHIFDDFESGTVGNNIRLGSGSATGGRWH